MSPNKKRAITFIEILVVIAIITIMAGGIVAMTHSFTLRQALETSATSLLRDLRQTQQFSRVQKDGYKYYGLCFFAGIGADDNNDGTKDRQGWKILRYEPPLGVNPDEMDPSQPNHLDTARYTVIKSSEAADNPEFLDNTYFAKGVILDDSSELQVFSGGLIFDRKTRFAEAVQLIIEATSVLKIASAQAAVAPSSIIFTPEGSATMDGVNLLESFEDDIVLYAFGNTKTIHITPLTGHIKIEE